MPKSLKYSAIEVATNAAFIFTRDGCSEVAATTIERFIPSSPKISSINSFTSRPRSPISAITLSWADVFLAIIRLCRKRAFFLTDILLTNPWYDLPIRNGYIVRLNDGTVT